MKGSEEKKMLTCNFTRTLTRRWPTSNRAWLWVIQVRVFGGGGIGWVGVRRSVCLGRTCGGGVTHIAGEHLITCVRVKWLQAFLSVCLP